MSKKTKEVRSLEVGLHVIYQISQFGLKIKDLPMKEGRNEHKNGIFLGTLDKYFERTFTLIFKIF